MTIKLNYIDLFAGAGGLSEGFIREGFNPTAHVESDKNACDTLTTRLAFHYYNKIDNGKSYYSYLKGEIRREELWSTLPRDLMRSVINSEISKDSIASIFSRIDEQLRKEKVDLIIGGPPCQAYSIIGRSRDPNRMRGDNRNYLFRHYVKFLERYKPKYFVFENVRGLLSSGTKQYLTEMLGLFKEAGYSTDLAVLNAEEFGVLQRRRRVFIIGHRGKRKFEFATVATIENDWQTKKDLFYDLPKLKPGQEMSLVTYLAPINEYLLTTGIRNGVDFTTQHFTRNHNRRDLEIYAIAIGKWLKDKHRLQYHEIPERLRTHKNLAAFLDRYKVIDPDGHSHTLVAHISKDGHYYIYPDLKQIRSISVREAARIQSFPDDYYFEGGRTSAFKQIGNAVPPLVAQSIARALMEVMA